MSKITELTIDSIKDTLARDKERLTAKYHLLEIGVFGSYTRNEQHVPYSRVYSPEFLTGTIQANGRIT